MLWRLWWLHMSSMNQRFFEKIGIELGNLKMFNKILSQGLEANKTIRFYI